MSADIGPWLGQCHFVQNGLRREMLAAVWCRSHQEFDAILTEILTAQHIEFLWSEEVHPAGPWVYTRPGRGGAELARTIHEGRRAAFGPAKTQKEAEEPPKEHLQITEIAGVIPLAFEVGNWDDRTVPEALEAPLFGQPDPTEAELATYGNAPLKTYAILDAAKMPYLLTSFLASSGLRYQSLYQGQTQEDLKEHAPYLIELEQENDFTKRLFTGPKGINGLWERELGIYVRSRAGFDDVRRHFRKFTRLQDENGKWFYFAFWRKTTMPALTLGAPVELAEALLDDGSCHGQVWILMLPDKAKAMIYQRQAHRHGVKVKLPKITQDILAAFDAEIETMQNTRDIAAALAQIGSIPDNQQIPDDKSLHSSLKALRSVGFTTTEKRQKALALFILAVLNQKHKEAADILNKTMQGPAIRLWHLERLIGRDPQ